MSFKMKSKAAVTAVAIAATAVGAGMWAAPVSASDHDEAPLVKADASMDITDLYVFASGEGKTTLIACWAGFNDSRPQPDTEGLFSEDALYTIHVDNDGDNVADHEIYWRYGKNQAGDTGVQFEGVPGVDGNVSGAVETVFDAGQGARVWSGRADDPFFFDVEGYLETLDTGTLSISSERDTLAGLNVTAAAIEIDTELLQEGDDPMQFWITASRK